jgi:biotin-dependent carboxylase-like uncharacterized protein
MMSVLEIEQAGPASILQDGGRFGFLSRGVSPAGAFDPLFHSIANTLAGNPADTAAVEFLMRGDTWRVQADSCRVAVAGDFSVQIDGEKAAPWRSFTLRRGQRIAIGPARSGARGYFAVAGGFALEPVLGSLSMHARTGIGPFGAKPFKAGTRLPLASAHAPQRAVDMRFDPRRLPPEPSRIRIVVGPQDHYFAQESIAALGSSDFELTADCDRMGFQVRGPEMAYRKDLPLISEGVALGSIQVLERGLFIVNLVDRQTVGGYPKIATVAGCDVRRFAQMRPGAKLRFDVVSVEDAQAGRSLCIDWLGQLASMLVPADPYDLDSEYMLAHNLISGVVFESAGAG